MKLNKDRKFFVHDPIDLGYDNLKDNTSSSGRTYITPEGKKYPSITTVLGVRSKEAIMEWRRRVGEEEANRVSRHAAARGTALHTVAENYINNDVEYFPSNTMPHVRALFKSVKPIIDTYVGTVVLQEKPLYSDHLGIAGRVDLVAEFNGKLSIVDFKTSKRRKKREDITNYFAQATAYSIMFEERTGIPVPQLVIIMAVDDDPKPIVFVEKRNSWVEELQGAILEYNKSILFGHA
jgi:genome maintenance exonuclease 1